MLIIITPRSKQTNAYFLSRTGLALSVSWANGGPAALDVMKFHEFFAGSEFAMQSLQSGFQAAGLVQGLLIAAASATNNSDQRSDNEKRRPQ
jgi:hypothetical protein